MKATTEAAANSRWANMRMSSSGWATVSSQSTKPNAAAAPEAQPQRERVGRPAFALAVADAGHQAEQRRHHQGKADPVEARQSLRQRPGRHEHRAKNRGE